MTRYFASDPEVVRLSVSAVVWRKSGAREVLLMQRADNGYWGRVQWGSRGAGALVAGFAERGKSG